MLKKVIYQYTNLTLTITGYSPSGGITSTTTSDTVSASALKSKDPEAFSFTCTVANDKALQIRRQPVFNDVIAFNSPVAGAAPLNIPGENIYPTATAAFTGDDINGAVTSGVTVDTDATDISANIKVGDKITTPVTTNTVDGAVTSGIKVVMDDNVAAYMAVGDRVTGNTYLRTNVVTVAALDPDGDNAKEFSLSEIVAIADGITLTFSSKINRSLTTVVAPFPADASAFTISQAIQFRDNQPLTFFNQMNYRWPINNYAHVIEAGNTVVVGTGNVVADSTTAKYLDTTVVFPNTEKEKTYINYEFEAADTLGIKPVITNGEITTQAGAVIFNKQQPLVLAG